MCIRDRSYGDQYHVLNMEYRFPIVWLERGYDALPFYLWRLHGAVYSDCLLYTSRCV